MDVLRERDGSEVIVLQGKVTVLGRDSGCDVVLPLKQVSGRHALIVRLSAHHYIEDLNSKNGTYVNGERIRQRTRLNVGDRIDIGPKGFDYVRDGADDSCNLHQTICFDERSMPTPPSVLSSLQVTGDLRAAVAPEAKLRAILEIAKNLGTALELKDVLPKVLESLFVIFPQADRGFILLRDPATGALATKAVRQRRDQATESLTVSRTIVDYVLHTGRAILSADAGLDERFGIAESVQALQLRSILCVPLLSQEQTGLGVIQLDTRNTRNQFRQEDLDVLVSAGSQAARAVELTQLHQERRDLEAAAQIQKSFLPEERPRIPGLQFFDHYSPARHVGGDYFDYIPLPGDRLAVALGDVSGKGVPAALLMARLSSAARSCLATAPTAAEAVRQLSASLIRAGTEDRFVTFVVAVLDLVKFTITLVNAGHMPPIRRKATAPQAEDVGEEIGGLPLAVLDKPYEETVVQLEPGDTFVLYTDGVTEARDAQGGFYGIERLRAVIERAPEDVEALGKEILADVQRYAGDRPQSDDLTLVCFSRAR